MLKKLISIKAVGAFQSYGPKGDVTFHQFTAIWGPNAIGKSTLCDIFRSVSSGDSAPLLGRRSLTATRDPEVQLLFDGHTSSFKNGAWDKASDPLIHIFDNTFVYENVHLGDFVEHDQKKNLYRVIVGADGVALAAAVDDLDEELTLFDILTKPAMTLTATDQNKVKRVAQELLAILKREKLVLDWRKHQQARAQVRVAIETALDNGLPDAYTPDVFRQKTEAVFQHVYENYWGDGHGVYAA